MTQDFVEIFPRVGKCGRFIEFFNKLVSSDTKSSPNYQSNQQLAK